MGGGISFFWPQSFQNIAFYHLHEEIREISAEIDEAMRKVEEFCTRRDAPGTTPGM